MGLGGFAEGAAEGLKTYRESIDSQNDVAFKLKLLNTQLEAQAKAAELAHTRSLASTQATKKVGEVLGIDYAEGQRVDPNEWQGLFGMGRAAISAQGRQGRGYGLDRPISGPLKLAYEKKYGSTPPDGLTYRDLSSLKGFEGKPEEIDQFSEATSGLKSVASLKNQLQKIDSYFGGRFARATASGGSLSALAFPEVAQAYRAAEKAYLSATGGKNITQPEKKIVADMIMSWSYDKKTQDVALNDFRNLLVSKLKGRMNSGRLGISRDVMVADLNDALIENGLAPVDVNAFSVEDKKPEAKSIDHDAVMANYLKLTAKPGKK